jgi:hypothetical protein
VTDDALESLLHSWTNFIRLRWRPGTCGSAEGRYLPERVADDEQRRPQPREWTVPELRRCERAVSTLPIAYAKLVRLVWLEHRHPAAAARLANLQPVSLRAWPAHRAQAFGYLRRSLSA